MADDEEVVKPPWYSYLIVKWYTLSIYGAIFLIILDILGVLDKLGV